MTDWPAFYRKFIADMEADPVSTGSLNATKAATSGRQGVKSVQSVNVSKAKREAAASPLTASLAALELYRPDRVEVAAWQRAIQDGRRLLIQWEERAVAFGWTAEDLFGLDPAGLPRRYDAMGLIWLLQGCRVVALTEHTAAIKGPSGNELTFYRKDAEFPGKRHMRHSEVVEPGKRL